MPTTVTTTTTSTTSETTIGPTGSDSDNSTTTTTTTTTTGPADCDNGDEQCADGMHQVCVNGMWLDDGCADGQFCDDNNGQCAQCFCNPGEIEDCVDAENISVCKDDCSAYEPQSCGLNMICVDGACDSIFCDPGAKICNGDTEYQVCNDNGTDYDAPVACGFGEECQGGDCFALCDLVAENNSSEGCEFWGVDLPNLGNQANFVYAIAVSNPSETLDADVTVYDSANGNPQVIANETIGPRQTEKIFLAGSSNGDVGYYPGDAGFSTTGIGQGTAFRLTSNIPVLATQWNPSGGSNAFTGEASLLLPTHTLAEDYIGLGWHNGANGAHNSFVAIVGTQDNTNVLIDPSVVVAQSPDTPQLNPGNPTQIQIDQYDYIQLMVPDGQDLSGTIIDANNPVAVFGGHKCAYIPDFPPFAYCDHLEEQILPLEAWGMDYVAARNPPRANETMIWRIVGSKDNTQVNFTPTIEIGNSLQVDEGEYVQFESQMDFHVAADEPILLAGYMTGCGATGTPPNCEGDPYYVQMVPTEQFRSDYVFLVDDSYSDDYIKLIRPTGAAIDVGCLGVVPENMWTSVGNSGYDVAVIDMHNDGMCDVGTNEATSDEPFGIIVSGTSVAASYAYSGGLDVKEINPLN